MSIKPVKAAHAAERGTSWAWRNQSFYFFFRLEVTLNSGSRGEKGAASVATSPPYSGPLLCVLRGGMVLLSFFLSNNFFLPSPSPPLCLISRCEEMRITALKARRGGAASRRVAALEKRSVLANLNRINDTLGWRGEKKKARTRIGGAPHSPPTTTPCVHAPRWPGPPINLSPPCAPLIL